MRSVFHKPCAVLRNAYVGIQVLMAELYWYGGPSLKYTWARRSRVAAIQRMRKALKERPDVLLQGQLDILEAEEATAEAQISARRAAHLERLRARCGMSEPQEVPPVSEA